MTDRPCIMQDPSDPQQPVLLLKATPIRTQMTPTTVGNHSERDPQGYLPNELKEMVIKYLDLPDVTNVRLLSRDWAVAGTKGLYLNGVYTFRPHRNDAFRLKTLCKYSWFCDRITHFKIYTGDFDLDKLNDRLSSGDYQYFSATGPNVDRYSNVDNEKYRQAADALEKILRGNVVVNWYHGMLEQVFSKLPNLTGILTISTEYPFKGEAFDALRAAWGYQLGYYPLDLDPKGHEARYLQFQDHITSIRAYSSLFRTLCLQNSPITTLTLDHMPISSLIPLYDHGSRKFNSNMETVLSKIMHLRLCVAFNDYRVYGYSKVGIFMKSFLQETKNLRSLDLKIQSTSLNDDERGFLHWDAGKSSWVDFYYSITWQHLESLRLFDIHCPVDGVTSILQRHSPTLKRFRFRGELAGIENFPWDWSQVVEDMCDIDGLNLEACMISHGFSGYDTNKVYSSDFILVEGKWRFRDHFSTTDHYEYSSDEGGPGANEEGEKITCEQFAAYEDLDATFSKIFESC